MKIVHQLEERLWREFVDSHPLGNIFHTPEMFQVFSRAMGHIPELWAVLDEQGQISTLFIPVNIILRNGLLQKLTTRSVVYGDLILPSGFEKIDYLKELIRVYKNQTTISLFTEIRHQADVTQVRVLLQKLNFLFEEHLNYCVDLSLPVEDVWKNIGKSTRKNIQKALKENVFAVEAIKDIEMLRIWYELIKKSFARAHVPLADYSLFKAAFEILYPKGMVQFLIGKVRNQYVAASVALLYKDVIYGWYRGFDRNYQEFIPNDLMVWHVLRWGSENGYKCFDFGGAGKPKEEYGPRAFKQKFGGSQVNYGRSIYIHAPLRLRMSRIGYALFRKFL